MNTNKDTRDTGDTRDTTDTEDYIISATWTVTGQFHIEANSEEEARQAVQSLTRINEVYLPTIQSCKVDKIEIDPSPDRTFEIFRELGISDCYITVKREHKQQARRLVFQKLKELKELIKQGKTSMYNEEWNESFVFGSLKEANIPFEKEYIMFD